MQPKAAADFPVGQPLARIFGTEGGGMQWFVGRVAGYGTGVSEETGESCVTILVTYDADGDCEELSLDDARGAALA